MKRLFLILAALLLFQGQAGHAQKFFEETPINGDSRAWLRLRNFYAPRVYPQKELPPNLWLRAMEQAQQLPLVNPDDSPLGIASFTGWEQFGPQTTNQGWLARVNAILIHPTTPSTLYIGVAKGGVWKSTDSGTTWANLTDTITQYVGCLAFDPTNPNIVLMGTGEEYFAGNTLGGVGIYRSTDGGATWTLKGNSTFAGRRINQITVDPTNTNRWVVSCDAGLYTTIDGGTTFTLRLAGTASALKRHPTVATTLFAALGYPFGGRAENGIYKSTDNGVTWVLLGGGLPSGTGLGRIEMDICKGTPNVLYAVIGNPGNYLFQNVWKTTNGGTTWSVVTKPVESFGFSWYCLSIAVDTVDPNIAYVGGSLLFRTTNGGTSWTSINPDHPDTHALAVHPTNPAQIYLGEDAGLFASADRGTTWTKKNAGRGTMEYYTLAVHPTDANKLSAGAQDNSTHLRTASNTYNVVIGGDGFWTAYKRSDPNIMLGEYQNGNIFRSTNGGVNWFSVLSLEGEGAPWSTPIVNDPTTPATFYAGSYRLWRSTSDGASGTWAPISPSLGSTLSRIAVAPSSSSVIYTGANNGKVFVTTNGGTNWTDRTAGLPTRAIGAVAVDPTNTNIVYVGLMGFGSGHVWKSANGGATWLNYSGDLPDTPVSGLVVNPLNTAQLLACTDTGVFLTGNGISWARYGTGLPNTPCTNIVGNSTTGYLTVSTYGRGIWRILLPGYNPVPVLSSLSPNTLPSGNPAFTLTVNGDNFLAGSKVRWNGADRTTTFVSISQLTAAIPASDVATRGTANVTVFNGTPGGGTSPALPFTIQNTAPVSGLAGATINFDGVDDAVTIPHNAAQNAYPLTVSFWLKTTQNTAARTGLVNKYVASSVNGWQLSLVNGTVSAYYFRNGTNYVWDGDTSTFNTGGIANGAWHHITLTVDASGGKLYVDGNVKDTQPWNGTPGPPTTTQPISLGQYGPSLLVGQMDEVSLWNVSRAPNDIQQDQVVSLRGNEAGLVAYYRLNERTGATTADATGHGFTGTLVGSPLRVASTAPVNTVHVLPGVPRPIPLTAFDQDNDALTYSVVTGPTRGTLSGALPNLTYTPGATYVGSDSFTYRTNDGTANSNVATVQINYGVPTVTVSGSVGLGLDPTAPAQTLNFTFRPVGGTPFVRTAAVGPSGTFSLSSLPALSYQLAVKGAEWLQKTVAVNASAGSVSGVNLTLRGGDANDDNTVDALDLAVLITSFNLSSSDPGFDADADFNVDGFTDALDLAILITNFNQDGDL